MKEYSKLGILSDSGVKDMGNPSVIHKPAMDILASLYVGQQYEKKIWRLRSSQVLRSQATPRKGQVPKIR